MRAQSILPAGAWDAAQEIDHVLIDYDRRYRRRILFPTEGGGSVLVDMAQAVRLRDGDGLVLDDGHVVRVCAQPEKLLDIHAHDQASLLRIVWHLGNRHLPVQVHGEHIRIRADHVIEEMVIGLNGHVETVEAPFDPEAGAYAGGHQHQHDDEEDHHHD